MRHVIVVGIAWLLLGAGLRAAAAQGPPRPPAPTPVAQTPLSASALPQRGDLLWTFAQEPPLFDLRVAMALATLMDPHVQATGATPRITFVAVRAPDFRAEPIAAPADDVPTLLRAAGFPQSPPFIEAGPCRVWAAPPIAMVAPILGQALHDALSSLGVRVQPCTTTARPGDAHLLVWVEGGAPPVIPRRQQPTFLSWQGFMPPPRTVTPPTQAPDAPPPPPPSSPPPRALAALTDCTSSRPDAPPDPSIAVPTEVQAIYVADERRIGITWRDDADNETCFGVLQTANAPRQLAPEGHLPVIIVALADATGATTLALPGRACFRIYAGNRTGRSALSDEACVEVAAPPVPPAPPPGDELPDWITRFRGRVIVYPGELSVGPVLEAYIGEGRATTLCGRTSVEPGGSYSLDVFGEAVLPGCGRAGDSVRFHLGPGNDVPLGALPFGIQGFPAGPAATFRPGEVVELDLRGSVRPRRPPMVPTPVPTPALP